MTDPERIQWLERELQRLNNVIYDQHRKLEAYESKALEGAGTAPVAEVGKGLEPAELAALSEVQDVDINYYVLVPFTTCAAAEWAAENIYTTLGLDCHVIARPPVNQAALVYHTAGIEGGPAPAVSGPLEPRQEQEQELGDGGCPAVSGTALHLNDEEG